MSRLRSLAATAAFLLIAAPVLQLGGGTQFVPQASAADSTVVFFNAPETVTPGGKLIYGLTVRNTGTSTLNNVVIKIPIRDFSASILTFLPNESSSRTHPGTQCRNDNGTVICDPITIARDDIALFTFTFQVPTNAQCGLVIENAADIYLNNNSTANNWSNTTRTTVTCVNPSLDLAMMKTGPAVIERNAVLIYSVWAVHVSGPTATNIIIQDPIPSGLSFDASNSTSSCHINGANVECTLPSLDHSEDKRGFNIAFRLNDSINCGETISNIATVSAAQPDSNLSNNTQNPPVLTQVTCNNVGTDVSINKSGPSNSDTGREIQYTLTVRNNGNVTAQNVSITDTFQSPLSFRNASNCSQNGNTITCSGFSLAAGETRTFVLTFYIEQTGNNSCSQNYIENFATVTTSTQDSNQGNNRSETVRTNLNCTNNGSLNISKTADRSTAGRGEVVTYRIRLENTNNHTVNNVRIVDDLPSELTFLSASDGGYVNGQTATWNNISVPGNGNRELRMVARVDPTIDGDRDIVNNVRIENGSSASHTLHINEEDDDDDDDDDNNDVEQNSTGQCSGPQCNQNNTNSNVQGNYNNVNISTVQQNFQNELNTIQYLPVTGGAEFTGPLENVSRYLSPMQGSGSLPGGAVATVLLSGLAAGGWVARRFFL